jgi:hypothetical protein
MQVWPSRGVRARTGQRGKDDSPESSGLAGALAAAAVVEAELDMAGWIKKVFAKEQRNSSGISLIVQVYSLRRSRSEAVGLRVAGQSWQDGGEVGAPMVGEDAREVGCWMYGVVNNRPLHAPSRIQQMMSPFSPFLFVFFFFFFFFFRCCCRKKNGVQRYS